MSRSCSVPDVAQRLQVPLLKEYALNHSRIPRIPNIFCGILLTSLIDPCSWDPGVVWVSQGDDGHSPWGARGWKIRLGRPGLYLWGLGVRV